MANPVRLAIVGCGGMARTHARSYVDMSDVEIVGLADIVPAALEGFAQAFSVPADRCFADHATLYDRVRPDIAVVVTRPQDHFAPTVAALERGIHVLCEKPIALDLEEADAMIAMSERTGAKLAINTQRHTDPVFLYARRLVREGFIGELRMIRSECKSYRAGYGMMNIGSHLFDAMTLYGGDPAWVFAHLVQADGHETNRAGIVEGDRGTGLVAGDIGAIHLGYPGGVMGVGEFWEGAATFGFEIAGTKGAFVIRGSEPIILHSTGAGGKAIGPVTWNEIRVPIDESLRPFIEKHRWSIAPMMRSLIAAIRENRDPDCSGRAGRTSLETIMAAYISQRTGARVPLPLADRRHPLIRWRDEAASPTKAEANRRG